jgi:hypothetical protein
MTEPTDHAVPDAILRCPACGRTAPLDQWATHPRQGTAILAAADEIDRLRAEVARLTPPPPPPEPSALATELATFAAHKATWLEFGYEGDWVVVKGGNVMRSSFPTYKDALKAGYERFGPVPFLVKQITRVEPVLVMRPTVVYPEG